MAANCTRLSFVVILSGRLSFVVFFYRAFDFLYQSLWLFGLPYGAFAPKFVLSRYLVVRSLSFPFVSAEVWSVPAPTCSVAPFERGLAGLWCGLGGSD